MFAPLADRCTMSNMNTTQKIAAARIAPGMTIQVTELVPMEEADETLQRLYPEDSHWVPCGSLKKSSPVRVVASVSPVPRTRRNLADVLVTFTTGEVVTLSTRQRVGVQ